MRGLKWGTGFSLMLMACNASAQKTAPLGADCRREIAQTCGLTFDRTKLVTCIKDKLNSFSPDCRDAMSARAMNKMRNASLQPHPLPPGAEEFFYGKDTKQSLDLFRAAASHGPAPLIVFVHGGGWSFGDKRAALGSKATHFTAQGYAFASLNYRLVPQATVEQEAADIAAAIAMLRRDAARHGIDPDRIVIMGHSAGAHLVALIGSDPSYLRAAGVPLASIRGAVLLDGAGYDVPRQLASPKPGVKSMYDDAFGSDPARQRALSPITHSSAPNTASWLILPVASRDDSTTQSQDFAIALRKGGADAAVRPVPDSDHRKLNRDLGNDGDWATAQVDGFVRTVEGTLQGTRAM